MWLETPHQPTVCCFPSMFVSLVAHLPTDSVCASDSLSVACSGQLLPVRTVTQRDFFTSLGLQCFWSVSAESPTPVLLDVKRWTGIPLLEGTSKRLISWAPWIKAAPGFRDSGRITSGEVISNHREFQFQGARRRQPAWESNKYWYHDRLLQLLI